MKLVQVKQHSGEENPAVVATVGPLEEAEADAYAAQLRHLIEQHTGPGLSVGTTSVESTSGEAADPPADPAELLRAVLSRDEVSGDGEHDLA